MKHQGKATQAGLRIILWTLIGLVAITGLSLLAVVVGGFVAALSSILFAVWVIFALFCLWFFRDPNPDIPLGPEVILAPAHGKVDVIDELTEAEFMGGSCRRISIFLSVFDVHVQRAPVAGRIAHHQEHRGEFLSALKTESAAHNENVLIGIESSESPGEKIGVRLIAGVLARRIVPWIQVGDTVGRGERISLIQFGSRVDLYLPMSARVLVQLGDRVRGGETVMACRG